MPGYSLTDMGNDLGGLIDCLDENEKKKFLNKEVRALSKASIQVAKEKVEEQTGDYLDGFKTEKAKTQNGKTFAKSVNDSNHGHLIEDGHINVDKNGNEHGFTQGKHVIAEATENYRETYYENTEDFVAKAISKSGLSE